MPPHTTPYEHHDASHSAAKLYEGPWQAMQKKTFTKWVNAKLAAAHLPEITDLKEDLSDGVVLIQLLEIIGNDTIPKYTRVPKFRIQKIENINKALDFIKFNGVPLTNIGAEDIVDGNEKLVLGMVWTIILRFTISEISEGDLTAKEGLLLWCQRKTAGYSNVNIKDFTFSWQDGLAFCALIHRHRPDLIDFASLNKTAKGDNLDKAFMVAERELGIARLLDVEDIVDTVKPDERSIMTYVAQYFHAFSVAGKMETAARRISKFSATLQAAFDLQHDYETRAHALVQCINDQVSVWKNTPAGASYQDTKAQLSALHDFKLSKKRAWGSERQDLGTMLGNVQSKLKTYNLQSYQPPESASIVSLDACWVCMIDSEMQYKRMLSEKVTQIKETLRSVFAQHANAFEADLNSVSLSIAHLDGELTDQLREVQQLSHRLASLYARLDDIRQEELACQEANVDENNYTVYTHDDLVYDFSLVAQICAKKAAFIENQIATRNMTNVTPSQLEEFESTFHFFDKDQSNSLSMHEFKAALAGLGITLPDKDIGHIFEKHSKGSEIRFEQFVAYMVSITEDTTSVEQLQEAFNVIAAEKPFLTEADLSKAQLDPAAYAYISKHMPRAEACDKDYDYNVFLKDLFGLSI